MRTADDYVLDFRLDDGSAMMTNFHGVPWHDAPAPRRLHWCRPQSEGFINHFTIIQRCACGAISIDGCQWMGKNSKKRRVTRAC